jgi:hypothetical protein
MVNKNLAQLQQHLVRKQEWLENELSQRPPSPQLGDIFIFIYPDDEIGSQWVIIDREQNGSQFFIVPADDTPMVGSMDIALPDSALCSPLTLRCDLGLWIQAKDFDLELRVGVLEEWHRRRALEKVKQISQAQFKVQCQKNLIKFLKFWHQGLPKRVYHLIGDMTSIGSILYQEMNYEPAYVDLKQQMNRERQSLIQTLSPIKKPSTPKKRAGLTWKAGWVFTAILVLAMFWIFMPAENSIETIAKNPIEKMHQTIYANKTDDLEEEVRDFEFRWEKPPANIFAFNSGGEPPSLAAKAFGAGLFTGRESLRGKLTLPASLLPPPSFESWLKTKWANYFQLGRWTFLLWTASQFPEKMPNSFWEQQPAIFAQLKVAFQTQSETDDAKEVMRQLKSQQIEQLLNKLLTSKENKFDIYYDLGHHLKKLMDFLAPPPMEK